MVVGYFEDRSDGFHLNRSEGSEQWVLDDDKGQWLGGLGGFLGPFYTYLGDNEKRLVIHSLSHHAGSSGM